MNHTWLSRFMNLAGQASLWSKDPSKQVGAVVVSPNMKTTILGYNGFPSGIEDTSARLLNKEVKNKLSLHAELNAILNAKQDLTGWSLFTIEPPCLHCALVIIQSGISLVCMPALDKQSSWYDQQAEALALFDEANISYILMEVKNHAN